MRRTSVLVVAVFAAACGSSDEGDDDGGDVQLAPETRLLENHPDFESVDVEPDRLTYHFKSDASEIDAPEGSLLIGAASGGYVRRATSTQADGNTLELTTQDASLTDGLLAADVTMPLVAEESDAWNPCTDGATCLQIDLIDLSDTVLYEGDVGGVPLVVRVPSGGLHFSPSVDVDLSIGFPGKIKRFSGVVKGAFTADLQIEAIAGGPVEFSQEIDLSGPAKPLYAYPFTILVPTPLGPLPIVGTVNLDVFVGFRASASAVASVSTGVSTTAEIAVGATYEDGDWVATGQPTVEATYDPVVLDGEASASIEAYARPEVSVIFYGVAGPRVALEPLLRLTSTFAPPDPLRTLLEACLRGELGFSIKILSFELADFSTSLERCLTLFDSNQSATEPLIIKGEDGQVVIDTDAGTIKRVSDNVGLVPPGVTFAKETQGEGAPILAAFGASEIRIDEGAQVQVVGSGALVLRSAGDVVIAGSLDLTGGRGPTPNTAGPGGSAGGVADIAAGLGAGAGGGGAPTPNSPDTGGGGGGNAAAGGDGGDRGASPGGTGGVAVEFPAILIGGSGGGMGGGTGDGSGRGGGGGGALRIEATGTVKIDATGVINAGGGGGEGGVLDDGGGGGGAGGTIDIAAAAIDVAGTIAANGGGGGAGANLQDRGATGQPGAASADPAQGGARTGEGRAGGSGGAREAAAGQPGDSAAAIENTDDNAGGGGGSAGRIHLRSEAITGKGTVSPAAN